MELTEHDTAGGETMAITAAATKQEPSRYEGDF
jgi:hypothetical protein